MKKQFLYHCTSIDYGDTLVVKKIIPTKSEKEPNVPRLCVCPTIPQCLAARLFYKSSIYVYKTVKPTRGVTPKNVWDSVITNERWLLPGHKLYRFTKIEKNIVQDISLDIAKWHFKTKNKSDYKVRIATLWRACVCLSKYTPKHLLNACELWCDEMNIDPMEIFS